MRAFVLMTLAAALTGCHQMPSWNPQGSLRGSSLLSPRPRSCAPSTNCSTNTCEQVVAPFGPCGQKYRVIPGKSHQALTMGWSSLPIPVPQFETVEVPPQLEPLPCPPKESCGASFAPACGVTERTHADQTQSQQSSQGVQQEAVRRLLAELQATRAASQHTGRTEQLQRQTRELESRVDQLLEALETQNVEAQRETRKPLAVPAPGPLPTISSRAPLPRQVIEQTGGYYRNRQPQSLRGRSQIQMWQHSPQNPRRGF